MLNGRMITLYRFIIQIADPFGFADLIVAAEHTGADIGYLEIVDLAVSQISEGQWYALNQDEAFKIGEELSKYFSINK